MTELTFSVASSRWNNGVEGRCGFYR